MNRLIQLCLVLGSQFLWTPHPGFIGVTGLRWIPSVLADDSRKNGYPEALAELGTLSRRIDLLLPEVERLDKGRLLLLKKYVSETIESLKAHGLGHLETLENYRKMVVAFHFSESFFNDISTDRTGQWIQEIMKTNQEIIEKRGFDRNIYPRLVDSIFTQMKQQFTELEKLPLPDDLRGKVRALYPDLGILLSVTSEGDRPKTFEAASAFYRKLTELYPEFDRVLSSNPAFETILSIQGLAEFYANYGQVEGAGR